mmetsp:Transcript_10939/g.20379  ORF Transcript_10939/g.20379 Transcript_10939/m.20379 type:complete len:82 (+) Transcript_10939:86-331(+)
MLPPQNFRTNGKGETKNALPTLCVEKQAHQYSRPLCAFKKPWALSCVSLLHAPPVPCLQASHLKPFDWGSIRLWRCLSSSY